MSRIHVSARVALAEHVGICHAFFGERETGLVNGVLDRIARTLRPEEMEAEHFRPYRGWIHYQLAKSSPMCPSKTSKSRPWR